MLAHNKFKRVTMSFIYSREGTVPTHDPLTGSQDRLCDSEPEHEQPKKDEGELAVSAICLGPQMVISGTVQIQTKNPKYQLAPCQCVTLPNRSHTYSTYSRIALIRTRSANWIT